MEARRDARKCRLSAVIVSPASADDNNGNWRTAERWSRLLRPHWHSRIAGVADCLERPDILSGADVLIALHARRSAQVIAAWRAAGKLPLVVVLTGTDLYHDIGYDLQAQRSLDLADRLVVLQEPGLRILPAHWRSKARAILQSTSPRRPLRHTTRHVRALMVGHLRHEKSPETWFESVRHLAGCAQFRFDHIGAPLDAGLAAEAQALDAAVPNFRYLGARRYPEVRRRIQAAHLLVHCSRLEGGAHVIMEAVCSGTPVLASRVDGNLGMLGDDYAGYFPWGDSAALAALLRECAAGPDGLLQTLADQCANRAKLFAPERERAALLDLLNEFTCP